MKRLTVSNKTMRDSFSLAAYLFAIVGTVASVTGVSIQDIFPNATLPGLIAIVLSIFFLLAGTIYWIKNRRTRAGIQLKLGDNTVRIKIGDLFSQDGWKVIPFNEFYDTEVDDRIISSLSLNGIFIEKHVERPSELHSAIKEDDATSLASPSMASNGKLSYELGTLKRYKGQFLLLAFSRFNNQNEAHLTIAEYEQCLMNLWKEISRVYAGHPINLPLLGSGITRFDNSGWSPSKQDLLQCMICTLRSSKVNLVAPVTIVLTEKAMGEVNLYDLKGWF